MPDGSKNFTLDTTNGPIATATVTRDELIAAIEHVNFAEGTNCRAIDQLSGTGIIYTDSIGNAAVRTITGSTGLSVANGNGAAGNPTISIGTPHLARRTLNDTEADTLTADKAVSIISNTGSYALPQPTISVISSKVIINNSSGNATITSSHWGDSGITTSVIIPTKQMAIFYTDLAQKWYVQVSGNLTIS